MTNSILWDLSRFVLVNKVEAKERWRKSECVREKGRERGREREREREGGRVGGLRKGRVAPENTVSIKIMKLQLLFQTPRKF